MQGASTSSCLCGVSRIHQAPEPQYQPESSSLPSPPATMTLPLREPATKSARRFLRKKERSNFSHPPAGHSDGRIHVERIRYMLSLPPSQIHTESQIALTLGMSVLHLPFVLRTYTTPAVRMTLSMTSTLSHARYSPRNHNPLQQTTCSTSVLTGFKLVRS